VNKLAALELEIIAAHRAVRAQAQRYHGYLIVQREAMGLRDHSRLGYVIPPPLGRAATSPARPPGATRSRSS
jgi:hypothetical protein